MAPPQLPVPNSITSFWRAEPHPLDNHRSTPELPAEADIVIIGAGYAGASTAYHILKHCEAKGAPLPSIVILEARQACSGATGRNGGHLKPDPYNRPSTLATTHGLAAAAEYTNFEVSVLHAVKRVIEDEHIDCDFALTRAVDALMTDAVCARMKAGYELLRAHGVEATRDVYFAEGAEAEQLSGVRGVKGCLTYSAAHLWPYKLVMGLLGKAVERGVNLQTRTPVVSVDGEKNGRGFYAVRTETRGTVLARKVVFATNGYTASVLPAYKGKIVPVRGICSHIVPARKPAPLLPNSYIIRWSDSAFEYLIPRLDGSIVVGGARERYYADRDSWYDNVQDDKLIESAKDYFDGYMQRVFHGWEVSGARTNKVWTGIMGYSSDGSPHVGVVPGRENQFILAGFTGHGMPQVFLAAKGLVAMMMEGVEFKDTGVPRIYQTSQARLDSTKNVVLDGWKASQEVAKVKL